MGGAQGPPQDRRQGSAWRTAPAAAPEHSWRPHLCSTHDSDLLQNIRLVPAPQHLCVNGPEVGIAARLQMGRQELNDYGRVLPGLKGARPVAPLHPEVQPERPRHRPLRARVQRRVTAWAEAPKEQRGPSAPRAAAGASPFLSVSLRCPRLWPAARGWAALLRVFPLQRERCKETRSYQDHRF